MYAKDEQSAIISITGSFNFDIQNEFRRATEDVIRIGITIRIDLSQTDHMDSAALGMLVLLNKDVSAAGAKLELYKPQGMVKKILSIARFNELINIVE